MATVSHEAYLTEESEIADVSRLAHNLNASDSGLHHTVSLMYEGGRHIGFGTTFENNMAARRFQT
ncbi:hypothetical protein DPMN_120323 [Dreissena polymorpha]|uniref:Uncharacterized protein n=1 Tax=Dreissena polymorpha TaxID=45954 RepID=A0A9D4JNF3_DREPO|nr:hypothetical protein DPMN_120323 [Dreissena polymorpha]